MPVSYNVRCDEAVGVPRLIDKVKDTVENVKDSAGELVHRVAAETEQQTRNVAGDSMTTDAKATSTR